MSGAPARSAIQRNAPAKLNLYLHVVGRRPDGYHLLDSLVGFADIGDLVTAAPADRLSLTVEGPFAAKLDGPPEENLIWRAAERLARAFRREPAAAIRLVKNLPVASGIGGGSSDAAAALHALTALWETPISPAVLAELGLTLGADVPVCLAGKTAWLGGIGEQIASAPVLPETPLVLVNPGIPLATPAVFKARQGPFSEPARFAETPRDAAALGALLEARGNDLTQAAILLAPDIASVLERLTAAEGALVARMSGSGATCFALFGTSAAAAEAAARLATDRPRWWVQAGRLLA